MASVDLLMMKLWPLGVTLRVTRAVFHDEVKSAPFPLFGTMTLGTQ
jgi:hypothetical protein